MGTQIQDTIIGENQTCTFSDSGSIGNRFQFLHFLKIVFDRETFQSCIDKSGLAASFAGAVSDTLVPRTIDAAKKYGRRKIAACGGVAANSKIRADFEKAAKENGMELYIPPIKYCGDNAAMIGCQGYYDYKSGKLSGSDLNAYAVKPIEEG